MIPRINPYTSDYYDILKDLSLRYRVPYSVVERICMSQFYFLKKVMESAIKNEPTTFKNVRMLGLGLFAANIRLVEKFRMNSKNNTKKEEV